MVMPAALAVSLASVICAAVGGCGVWTSQPETLACRPSVDGVLGDHRVRSRRAGRERIDLLDHRVGQACVLRAGEAVRPDVLRAVAAALVVAIDELHLR